MTESITRGQVVAIHALAATLGIDEATYRLMLHVRYGVASSTALSCEQASQLIDELKVKAGQRSPHPSPPPSRGRGGEGGRRARRWPVPPPRDGQPDATITARQQAYLDRLFAALGWDQRRRDGLCRKAIGRPWPQSNNEVTALLTILRPMALRAASGQARRAASGRALSLPKGQASRAQAGRARA